MNPFNNWKILRNPERLVEWLRKGTTDAPIGFDLDLTNICPHRCPRCLGCWTENVTAETETDKAIAIIDEMWSLGCKAVNFTGGGEPLAHPDAVNIIKYASEKGLSVGLITNGSLLTPEGAIILADSCAWIRISLDAADPLRFSLVHGVEPSEYDIVLENIKYLAGIKDRKAVVGVGILTEEAMRNDIVKSAGIVKSLGCDYVQFRPFDTSRDDVSKEIETAKRLYESNSFSVNSNLYRYANLTNNIKRTHSTCYAQNFWTIINAQGYVQICCDQRLDNGRIGDLNKQTFSEVWHGDRRKAVIESIDCMRDCPPDCRMNAHNVMLEHFAEPICHEAHL